MIALPTPGTPAFRALALIVAEPGTLDAAALGDLLWPRPVHRAAFTRETYAAHVAALRAWASDDAQAQREHCAATLLHRLQQRGLVERCGRVRVAPWFEAMIARREALTPSRGEVEALRLARPDPEEDEEQQRESDFEAHRIVLREVRACPATVREVLAEGGGWRRAAYADLGAWGVLITPTRRTATKAGIALVKGAAP